MPKTILITGSTNGIGKAAAVALARQGHRLIIHGRSPERCQATMEVIRQTTRNTHLDFVVADLASLAQVRTMAQAILDRYDQLDVLVNNAGAYFLWRRLSPEGFELTWAVNYLSSFLLTNLLLDLLRRSAPARIVNVASAAHWGAQADFTDLEKEFDPIGWRAYGRSKLANILFARELANRLNGSGVTANSMHPGFVASGFVPNIGRFMRLIAPLYAMLALTPEQGAETVVYLATSAEVEGISGQYFISCKPANTSPAAKDQKAAYRLWQESAQAVGLL